MERKEMIHLHGWASGFFEHERRLVNVRCLWLVVFIRCVSDMQITWHPLALLKQLHFKTFFRTVSIQTSACTYSLHLRGLFNLLVSVQLDIWVRRSWWSNKSLLFNMAGMQEVLRTGTEKQTCDDKLSLFGGREVILYKRTEWQNETNETGICGSQMGSPALLPAWI